MVYNYQSVQSSSVFLVLHFYWSHLSILSAKLFNKMANNINESSPVDYIQKVNDCVNDRQFIDMLVSHNWLNNGRIHPLYDPVVLIFLKEYFVANELKKQQNQMQVQFDQPSTTNQTYDEKRFFKRGTGSHRKLMILMNDEIEKRDLSKKTPEAVANRIRDDVATSLIRTLKM
eukprot:TCONS_00040423-protein